MLNVGIVKILLTQELFTTVGLFCTCAHSAGRVKEHYGMQAVKTVNNMTKCKIKLKENGSL